ncbi:MAG: S-layer homology domain-containing protein [Paenibacillus sp.]|uniref:S-layer homology domain-containing protein n=1 Tax=Paenibacillus sp. TaxID=58172 RepID=UPI002901951F|nr:S-layer homology domain-containing protein [Paenibacillus sp.]MDU2239718.1 S-layer homology domain-containing protein [Paenibacillus sp.]
MNVLKIHKQWIAVLLILTMAFGFPVGEASAAEIEILDQEQSLINGNVWVNQESSRFQTFTPSITGKLSGIELNLMDTNGSPGAILVNIYEESNPSVLLVTGSSSAGYKSGWVRVDFPADGPELKRNTMYRMVVSTEQGGASGFGWYTSPSDDYPRGYTFAYGIDLTFRTYMIPDYSVSVEESELSVDTSSLVADGTSQATVTVRLKDRQGSYITTGGAAVAISSTLGSVGSVMDHNNGTYTATLTASTTAGTSTISATVGGNALAAKATVQFLPGPPSAVTASTGTHTPIVGASNAVNLSVSDAFGNRDTAFNGTHEVTISGYLPAPDGSYGSFNGAPLMPDSTVVGVNFTNGVATAGLILHFAQAQVISINVAGVSTPSANPLNFTPIAGNASAMKLTTDIAAPSSNGGVFTQQPVVTLLDAYGNVSVNDSSTVVTALKKDAGDWTLKGTTSVTASAGVAPFSDLGATNAASITGAQLVFHAGGLAQITSLPVTLPVAPARTVSASAATLNPVAGADDEITLTVKDGTGDTDTAFTGPHDVTLSGYLQAPDGSYGSLDTIVSFTPPTDNGGSAITSYEVTASPGNIVVSGTAGPITIPGLPDGVYTFTVRAINDAGRSPASQASAPLVLTTTSSGGGKEPAPAPVPAPVPTAQVPVPEAANVLINGKLEQVGTVKTAIVNNQTVTTVVIDGEKLGARLAAMQRPVVSIRVNAESDVVVGEIGGRILQRMALKQAVIEITSKRAAYTLPVSQLNFDNLKDQLGADDASTDLKVQIEIAVPTSDIMEAVNHAAAQQKSSLVAPPLNFTVRGVLEDNKVEVTGFGGYVERTIAIPNGADPLQITTAIVVEPDGTVRHVPTKVMVIDGQRYAIAKSLTNSTYAVVWHPVEFPDVSTHWAKEAVNDMGSRMIVGGTAEGIFDPDRDITRAEFAAILVSALGLELENGPSRFTDVKSTAWYSGAVNTAYAYHFIDGFENGTFHPSDKMTREQALTVLAKAMALTGLKSKLPQQETEEGLSSFTDIADASPWAMAGIADCLRAGMVSGRGANLLAPKAFMSRAEVAVTMKKLLQKSELI